jgi:hypothetical protein
MGGIWYCYSVYSVYGHIKFARPVRGDMQPVHFPHAQSGKYINILLVSQCQRHGLKYLQVSSLLTPWLCDLMFLSHHRNNRSKEEEEFTGGT